MSTIHELRREATQRNVPWLKTDTKVQLEQRISAASYTTRKPEEAEAVAAPVKKEPKWNTEQEIRDAIQRYTDKGMEARFDENTWHFKFRGGEDSGHLTAPLALIIRRAETVSRGAIVPRFDSDVGMVAGEVRA